jgi:hypothetical protein
MDILVDDDANDVRYGDMNAYASFVPPPMRKDE